MEVYVIKHLETSNVVAVIEAQPDVSDEQALIHWLASCGLTEKAASQFRCIYAPVIPWASLGKMFEPITDDIVSSIRSASLVDTGHLNSR